MNADACRTSRVNEYRAPLWRRCGLLDYTPWIVLAKALRIYAARGAELRAAASRALDEGLAIVGQRVRGLACGTQVGHESQTIHL